MSLRSAVIVVALLLVAACSGTPASSPRTSSAAPRASAYGAITADELRRDLFAFAADSFRGRETGTPDANRAAAFLARRVQQLGLEPAGDSLYMQRVPLVRQRLTRLTRLTVTMNNQTRVLRLGADVAPFISFGDELPEPLRSAEGDMVFVGYGPTTEEEAAQLATVALEGKVVVLLHGAPAGTKAEEAKQLESSTMMGRRLGYLWRSRPAGFIVLMTGGAADVYSHIAPELLRSVVAAGNDQAIVDPLRTMPLILVGIARRGSPLLPARWPNDMRVQELGRRFNGRIDVQREAFTGYNVVAVVRGRDPRLNKTYLAYGAHYDHIGVLRDAGTSDSDPPVDSIANGADDDGSGSVALLAIAKQMAAVRPKRSVLFVWHVAEEKGLLGSEYFTEHSPVPMDSIVAQLNADMLGRNDPNTVALVGPRAAPNYLSWRLGMIVDSVNRAYPSPFHIDRQWDSPDDPDQVYERSDHYSYAKKGVPVIFFTTGPHADYHRVTDEASKVNYDKLARVTRLLLDAGSAVANRTSRPTSDAMAPAVSTRSR